MHFWNDYHLDPFNLQFYWIMLFKKKLPRELLCKKKVFWKLSLTSQEVNTCVRVSF